jgi:hypothetical protein
MRQTVRQASPSDLALIQAMADESAHAAAEVESRGAGQGELAP